MRNGANLEADDTAYWTAIAKFYPTLDAPAQREIGLKLLKRLWLWSAWAHVADRHGTVRRALAYASRDYWDKGSLAALDPLTRLIQAIRPARPFGPALYYSVAAERAVEQQSAAQSGPGKSPHTALSPAELQAVIEGGVPLGYYVSDAALGRIARGGANAPSAWVVVGSMRQMPPSERAALAALAPIVSSPAAYDALPSQPIRLTGGLAGFAFIDQSGRLIVVVSNPDESPRARARSGTLRLAGLEGTAARVTDLFGDASETTIPVDSGAAIMPLSIERWDTRVFAIASATGR